MRIRCLLTLLLAAVAVVQAQGQEGTRPEGIRRIPPPGIAVPDADRVELEAGVRQLGGEIMALRGLLKDRPALLELLPDVQIYHNAVRYALQYNEIFNAREIPTAKTLLLQGMERAQQLRDGKAPWATATGLVARGYVSKIDGSVQPYGLVVPASYRPDSPYRHRLDLWFHGRGENLSELNFLRDRQRSPGEFVPRDAFVLHPYGRYCNANRFAGEVDTFEAMEHVRRHYPIDEDRIAVRGFSMGGAACWQFATHHAGLWAAAAPGAGFSETAVFLNIARRQGDPPTWWEQKLWRLYDSIDYAENLSILPTVAYSGEEDRQKQAADAMAAALKREGIELVHVIGPKTGHSYHPQAKEEINRRIDRIMAAGRDPMPRRVRFTTWTLRYHRMAWLQLDDLERHWEQARVTAEITGPSVVALTTRNVSALTLAMPPGLCPLAGDRRPTISIDGQKLTAAPVMSDRSWTTHLQKTGRRWAVAPTVDGESLRKRHGLQGPIDDAFMDRFLMVAPTGCPLNPTVGAWVAGEMARAVEHWRRQFRGEAPVKEDTAVTDEEIASSNLVLWGDPRSNHVLARIASRLPIRWDARGIHAGGQSFAADQHVPVLIYPNPLNPKRYVVLNSGFPFREYDYLNNARQTPKLPDWAIVDISVPPSPRWPGRIASAGFFGERWELQAEKGTGATRESAARPVEPSSGRQASSESRVLQ